MTVEGNTMHILRQGSYAVLVVVTALLMAACANSAPASAPTSPAVTSVPAPTVAVATTAPTAAPVSGSPTPASQGTATPATRPEAAIGEYFTTNSMGTTSLILQSIKPVDQTNPDRHVYLVELDVMTAPGTPTPWSQGVNTRFVAVEKTAAGWIVTEVASSPISTAAGATTYQRFGGRDLGISFEVPANWTKAPDGYTFRAVTGAPVVVGVVRQDVPSGFNEQLLLPKDADVLAREPLDLGWAKATRYTIRVSEPAAGQTAPSHQIHVVINMGKTVYDVFSSAPATDESARQLADDVRTHMLRTVTIIGG